MLPNIAPNSNAWLEIQAGNESAGHALSDTVDGMGLDAEILRRGNTVVIGVEGSVQSPDAPEGLTINVVSGRRAPTRALDAKQVLRLIAGLSPQCKDSTFVTVLRRNSGRLSKAYALQGTEIVKTQASTSVDYAEARVVRDADDLAALLAALRDNEALCLANNPERAHPVHVSGAEGVVGSLTRTKGNFDFVPGAGGVLLFDIDVPLSISDAYAALLKAIPKLAEIACVGRLSTSAGITSQGRAVSTGGVHLYIFCKHMEHASDALKAIGVRSWLTGQGRIELSRKGDPLVRQLVDTSVASPERIIYEAAAKLGPGLSQAPRPPIVLCPGNRAIELTALVDSVSEAERQECQRITQAAVEANRGRCQERFDAWRDEQAQRLNMASEDAKREFAALSPTTKIDLFGDPAPERLPPKFWIEGPTPGTGITVANLVARLDAGEDLRNYFPDPVEGLAYGATKAHLERDESGALRQSGGGFIIHSFAHGGRRYLLGRDEPLITVGTTPANEPTAPVVSDTTTTPPQLTTRNSDGLVFANPAALTGTPIPMQWAVDGWVPFEGVTVIGADGGTGKTVLAIQMALCIAAGRRFLGLPVKRARVFMSLGETSPERFHERVSKCARHLGVDPKEFIQTGWLTVMFADLAANGMQMTDGKGPNYRRLQTAIVTAKAEALFIDPVASCYAGSEIDRAEVTAFISSMRSLVPGPVVLTMHTNKISVTEAARGRSKSTLGANYSGSTGWNNAARARIELIHADNTRNDFDTDYRDTGERVIYQAKNNDGESRRLIHARLDWTAGAFVLHDNAEATARESEDQEWLRLFIEMSFNAGMPCHVAEKSNANLYAKVRDAPGRPARFARRQGASRNIKSALDALVRARLVRQDVYIRANRRSVDVWTTKSDSPKDNDVHHKLVAIDGRLGIVT